MNELRLDKRLYLPALTHRRGFSSPRVEYLLNWLVSVMPPDEAYFEVGTLEGRTLEAAAHNNVSRRLFGCDPGTKYGVTPEPFDPHVTFISKGWRDAIGLCGLIGLSFYDGDHSFKETADFLDKVRSVMPEEAVVVLDDWDRETVRVAGCTAIEDMDYQLIAEMPEYTDGLTCAPHHFGYQFGVAVLGWRRR